MPCVSPPLTNTTILINLKFLVQVGKSMRVCPSIRGIRMYCVRVRSGASAKAHEWRSR